MIIPTNTYPNIVEAKIINCQTNEVEDLMQRPDFNKKFARSFSDSLFKMTPVLYKNYRIMLRFDFNDKNEYGDPTLDADFYKNDRKLKIGGNSKLYEAHHTSKTCDRDGNFAIYRFKFDNLEMIFKLQLTKVQAFACKAHIVKPS